MNNRFILTLFSSALLLISSCTQRSYIMSSVWDDKMAARIDEQADISTIAAEEKNEEVEVTNATTDIVIDETSLEAQHVKYPYFDPFTRFGVDVIDIELDSIANAFTFPIDGKFSSHYGIRGRSMHTGCDIVAPAKSPIYAIFGGVVRMSKPYAGYGNVVVVAHNNGLESVYAHNNENLVNIGDVVTSGQKIALCGRTGNATTDHLHLEIRVKGEAIDPALLINFDKKSLQSGLLSVTKGRDGTIMAKLDSQGNNSSTLLSDQGEDDEELGEIITNELTAEQLAVIAASASSSRGVRVGDEVYSAPEQPKAKEQWHTIVSGDTLSGIAQKYKTTVNALCQLNNITRNSVIRSGKKLRVK